LLYPPELRARELAGTKLLRFGRSATGSGRAEIGKPEAGGRRIETDPRIRGSLPLAPAFGATILVPWPTRPIRRVGAELPPCPASTGRLLLAGLLLGTAGTPASAQGGALTLAYQLTHSVKADPSLAPDGRRMVFITTTLGREQLFVMNIDGSETAQLTHDDADHEDPAWSPRGDRIAFVRIKDSQETIYLMNADGSGVGGVDTRQRPCHPPAMAAIYTIGVRDRRITRLISGGVNTYPAWSPDGKRIAFRRMLGEMNSEVFVANRDGSEQRNLTNHPAFAGLVAGRRPDCVCVQSECELSDLYDEGRRDRRAAGREYRGPGNSAAMGARWQDDLLLGLPEGRLRRGLQHLRGTARASGALTRAPTSD
jgi:hypothetical protein